MRNWFRRTFVEKVRVLRGLFRTPVLACSVLARPVPPAHSLFSQRHLSVQVYPLLFVAGVGAEPSLPEEDQPITFHECEKLKQATCERFMRGDPVDQLTMPYVMRPRQIGYLHTPLHSDEATFDLLAMGGAAC